MAPKLSNQDEPDDHDCVGQSRKHSSNLIGGNLAVTDLGDKKEYQEEQSRKYDIAGVKPSGAIAQCSSELVRTKGQYNPKISKEKRIRRKFSLPIHSLETHKDTSFKRRRRRKQQMSLENFFEDKNQELRFRFGSSYRDFVLPVGVEPSPTFQKRK